MCTGEPEGTLTYALRHGQPQYQYHLEMLCNEFGLVPLKGPGCKTANNKVGYARALVYKFFEKDST
eukprot:9684518-Karenia_brevis.AAC.1